jgi:hypothetical protein
MRSIDLFMHDIFIGMLKFYAHMFLQNILLDYASKKILRTRNLLILPSREKWIYSNRSSCLGKGNIAMRRGRYYKKNNNHL